MHELMIVDCVTMCILYLLFLYVKLLIKHIGPIIPLLGALGYDVATWTPYASLITLELYEKDGNYFVLASFNGEIIIFNLFCDYTCQLNSTLNKC